MSSMQLVQTFRRDQIPQDGGKPRSPPAPSVIIALSISVVGLERKEKEIDVAGEILHYNCAPALVQKKIARASALCHTSVGLAQS